MAPDGVTQAATDATTTPASFPSSCKAVSCVGLTRGAFKRQGALAHAIYAGGIIAAGRITGSLRRALAGYHPHEQRHAEAHTVDVCAHLLILEVRGYLRFW